MSEAEKTRRETLKLAAAVAAFGAALGFRQTAEATGKLEHKFEHKIELKLFADGKLVHTCPVPEGALRQVKLDTAKFEHKAFLNGQAQSAMGWDVKSNKKL